MASTIARFVRSTRLRRRLAYGIASVATHAVVVGALLQFVTWLYPAVTGWALGLGLGWLGLVVAWHGLHRGLSLRAADGSLGLQDRLVTWWSIRDRGTDPMTRWLEEDLERSIEQIPEGRRGQLWRRPLRRLIWVLPLLFIVLWLGPLGHRLFLSSDQGVTRQADRGRPAGSGARSGEQKVAGEDPQRGDRPRKSKDPKRDPQAPDEPAKKNDRDPPRDPEKLPPRPIPELSAEDQFVIPKFIGEAKGRVGKARVAVVEDAVDPATKRAREEAARQQRAARRHEFEAAAERALRLRHVPSHERPFVKRYFAELLKAARRQPR